MLPAAKQSSDASGMTARMGQDDMQKEDHERAAAPLSL